MSVLMFTSPLMFIMSIQFDALRSEGKMAAMAIMSICVTVFNIIFNYIFIAQWGWGRSWLCLGYRCGAIVGACIAYGLPPAWKI